MDDIVIDIDRSSILDMIISLDHYADHLREILAKQNASIEDTIERNELVIATWLSEKFTNLYSHGNMSEYQIKPNEWDCLLQSLEVHISALNYTLDVKYSNPDKASYYDTLLMENNIHKAWELKKQLQNL